MRKLIRKSKRLAKDNSKSSTPATYPTSTSRRKYFLNGSTYYLNPESSRLANNNDNDVVHSNNSKYCRHHRFECQYYDEDNNSSDYNYNSHSSLTCCQSSSRRNSELNDLQDADDNEQQLQQQQQHLHNHHHSGHSEPMSVKSGSSSKVNSYCYFSVTILFIILILFLHVRPSHEQYFSATQTHSSSSGSNVPLNSDEWDSPNFPSSLISSSSSLTSSSSSSSSSASAAAIATASSATYGHGYNCVNIPVNFTLCKNIGYSKMMVPNLLGHDSLQEAEYHAKAWVPLLGLQCHPDTQRFLCSLFTPICLDRPIYPCRSLCQLVQAKCEPRMLTYKYPWPSMLKCDQFPEDHDLCIRPGAANTEEKFDEPDCPSCHQAHTCENIVDNYCRANFVFRAKFKRSNGSTMEFRKGRWFKPPQEQRRGRPEFRSFDLEPKDSCCNSQLTPGIPYIVMGIVRGDQRVVSFVMPWNGKDKILKNAVRTFRSMDCSNPLPMSVMAVGEEESRNKTRVINSNSNSNNNRRRQRRRKDGQQQQQQQQNNNRRGRQYGGCRVTVTSDKAQ